MNNDKKNLKKEEKNDTRHLEKAFYQTHVASANDCTGFVPIIPDTDYEAEAYSDLVDVPVTPRYFKRYHS